MRFAACYFSAERIYIVNSKNQKFVAKNERRKIACKAKNILIKKFLSSVIYIFYIPIKIF